MLPKCFTEDGERSLLPERGAQAPRTVYLSVWDVAPISIYPLRLMVRRANQNACGLGTLRIGEKAYETHEYLLASSHRIECMNNM